MDTISMYEDLEQSISDLSIVDCESYMVTNLFSNHYWSMIFQLGFKCYVLQSEKAWGVNSGLHEALSLKTQTFKFLKLWHTLTEIVNWDGRNRT